MTAHSKETKAKSLKKAKIKHLHDLEYIVANVPGYVYWKDAQSRYMGCNNNLAKLFGLENNSKIIGKTDYDFLVNKSELAEKFIQDDKLVMKTKSLHTSEYELPVQRFDGNNLVVRIDKMPLYDENDKVAGVLAIAVDITTQKLSEKVTNIAHTFVEDILYNFPGLIYWKNMNLQYVGFNKNVVILSGLSREELVGKTDKELNWGRKEAAKFQQDDREVMNTGVTKITENEIPIKRPDGNFVIVRTEKSQLLDREGNVVGILGVALDITDQKILEEKLSKETEKFEIMEKIAATVAHELRTPLRAISAAADGIKTYFPKLLEAYKLAKEKKLPVPNIDPAHYRSISYACNAIESEAQGVFTVIEMLLINLKGISFDAASIDLKDHSIKACIEVVMRRYPFDLKEKSLVHWDNIEDFVFKGDEILIIHILFNLLKNALYQIKAASKGDIHIWTEVAADYNQLHFKDTAKGIPAEILPHIFEQFYTKTYHGTGIGLAFCKTAMDVIGGRINCDTKEGEYADFVLYFPKS